MKNLIRLFLILVASTSFLLTSCEIENNDPIDNDSRDSFIGVWNFYEAESSTRGQNYLVTIVKDPSNSSQVELKNIGNSGDNNISAIGTVTSGQIVLSAQKLKNNWEIYSGIGKLSNTVGSQMTFTYEMKIGAERETHTAIAVKK